VVKQQWLLDAVRMSGRTTVAMDRVVSTAFPGVRLFLSVYDQPGFGVERPLTFGALDLGGV